MIAWTCSGNDLVYRFLRVQRLVVACALIYGDRAYSRGTIVHRAAVLAATTLLFAAGCGESPKSSTPTDAAAVVAKLKAAGMPIANVAVVTAANDPNHMLGRPNQFTGKNTFSDTRIDVSKARSTEAGAVDLGGAVEVFSNSSDAKRRATYITTMEKSMPMFGTEYDYTSGNVLLRLSQALTPDQAAAYKNALG